MALHFVNKAKKKRETSERERMTERMKKNHETYNQAAKQKPDARLSGLRETIYL